MEGYSLFLDYDAGGGKRGSQWMHLCYDSRLDAESARELLEQVYGKQRIEIRIEHRSIYPGQYAASEVLAELKDNIEALQGSVTSETENVRRFQVEELGNSYTLLGQRAAALMAKSERLLGA